MKKILLAITIATASCGLATAQEVNVVMDDNAPSSFTGTLDLNIESSLSSIAYISSGKNILSFDENVIDVKYFKLHTDNSNRFKFNTTNKGDRYIPYSASIGYTISEAIGQNMSNVGWAAMPNGSSYNFSISPVQYKAGSAPGKNYCINVTVDGKKLNESPICSVSIIKGDSFKSDIWIDPKANRDIMVDNFTATSSVIVDIISGEAESVTCVRENEWNMDTMKCVKNN